MSLECWFTFLLLELLSNLCSYIIAAFCRPIFLYEEVLESLGLGLSHGKVIYIYSFDSSFTQICSQGSNFLILTPNKRQAIISSNAGRVCYSIYDSPGLSVFTNCKSPCNSSFQHNLKVNSTRLWNFSEHVCNSESLGVPYVLTTLGICVKVYFSLLCPLPPTVD